MGTISKSCRLDQDMLNAVISQANSEGQVNLKSRGSGHLKWHCDMSFALHNDFRSHTGSTFSMGDGAITSLRKHGMNTKSSTKAEVVATDEIVSPMIWTQLFLKVQGYPIKGNILYQDNKSAMLIETNGCKSAGKHSHHLNIQYFYITNQKAKGQIDINYCRTDEMIRDCMTKPLHGAKFDSFCQQIMHLPVAAQLMVAAVLHF